LHVCVCVNTISFEQKPFAQDYESTGSIHLRRPTTLRISNATGHSIRFEVSYGKSYFKYS